MSKGAQLVGRRLSDAEYNRLVVERIKARCIVNERGCWVWQGFKRRSRNSRTWYGLTNYRDKSMTVHRAVISATQRVAGFREVVMHSCDNGLCGNPAHLEFGTTQKNLKDAAEKGSYRYHKSHYHRCKHGHEFTPENTWICSRGFRNCRECQRQRCRQYWLDGTAKARQLRNRAKAKAQQDTRGG